MHSSLSFALNLLLQEQQTLSHYSHSTSTFNQKSIEYRHTRTAWLSHSIGMETLSYSSCALGSGSQKPSRGERSHRLAYRLLLSQAYTDLRSARLSCVRALSLSLCRLCCATRFVAEVRSQRAQLSETRSQRAVSQQSVVGQSARTQLFALRLPKLQ